MIDLNNLKKKNICIIGLMGSGKSLIGKELSRYLNLKFFDTDKEIELKIQKNINTIFKEEGEKYFRDIEEKICMKLLTHNNCVSETFTMALTVITQGRELKKILFK